jgi:hypothetical protein
MPNSHDRFLRHRTPISRSSSLGRVFNVTRETWELTADPRLVRPQTQLVVSGRTASDAADIAREAAEAFARHGFHKPSGSWWGASESAFHRFVVHAGRRGSTAALVLISGVAGLAAVVFTRRRSSRDRATRG